MYDEQATGAAPGWYDDPNLAGTKRYWDGSAWTDHTAGGYPVASKDVYKPYQRTVSSRAKLNLYQANPQSFVAIGFAVAYLIAASTAGIQMLGIIPALSAFRAVQSKEPLAPIAAVVAVVALVAGFTAFAG